MTIPNIRLTRLEAVNRILRKGLGASPILTLTEPLPAEAVTAREKLDDVQRDLMSEGWDMNTDDLVTVAPDGDGFVHVPANAIRATYEDKSRAEQNVVVRGGRMYDETNQTFVFTTSLRLHLVRLLDFTDLEYYLQRYIVARAAREMQAEMVGNLERVRTLIADEQNALAAARRADNDSARYNILAAPAAAKINSRVQPRLF